MRFFILFIISILLFFSCNEQSEVIQNGVSYELAKFRKSSIENLSYDLFFDIPEKMADDIQSKVIIQFNNNSNKSIQLDFKEDPEKINFIVANGDTITPDIINEHIVITGSNLQNQNNIEISFISGNQSLNRNENYLYTLFVPARARTVFPLFDQPNLKAKYKLQLEIPVGWEGFTNGELISEEINDDRKKLSFRETKPISSYLFAFGAGEFKKTKNGAGTMTMYYRESDESKVNRNTDEIFELHQKSLDWLEEYTGIPYPFEKFDFALIPTFQYGGMEHPGSIFYRESALMLNESPSINQQLRRASLIAHETAHMWFGDLVTMDWFDDVWLKEVFANFYAAKIVNPSFPEVNHDLRFLLSHYPRAYSVDRTKGSHPIQQNLENLENAGSLYGAIIYQKAPIVMRNLEDFLGEETFREGIIEYLNAFSYGNATWDDLISIMKTKTEMDLEQWNNDWIKSEGMASIIVEEEQDQILIQPIKGINDQIWAQSLELMIDGKIESLKLDGSQAIMTSGDQIITNFNGKTYGYLAFTKQILDNQILDLSLQEEITRASIWISQYENLLNYKLEPTVVFERLMDGISVENNPLILGYQMGILNNIFWNFIDSEKRETSAESLENMLFEKMMRTADVSVKRVCYNGYKNIVTSENGLKILKDMWADQLDGFDLSLSEDDKIELSYELSIKGINGHEDILKKQYYSLKNEDNKAKMAFVMPSVSSNEDTRDSVFNSLLYTENRAQEPWVLQVLNHLHHPVIRSKSIKYLEPGLSEIQEIKNTGDIFFPMGWLSSMLGNHNSDEALEVVNKYLENKFDLDQDLKNKVYQASDMLERSASHLRKIKG